MPSTKVDFDLVVELVEQVTCSPFRQPPEKFFDGLPPAPPPFGDKVKFSVRARQINCPVQVGQDLPNYFLKRPRPTVRLGLELSDNSAAGVQRLLVAAGRRLKNEGNAV